MSSNFFGTRNLVFTGGDWPSLLRIFLEKQFPCVSARKIEEGVSQRGSGFDVGTRGFLPCRMPLSGLCLFGARRAGPLTPNVIPPA